MRLSLPAILALAALALGAVIVGCGGSGSDPDGAPGAEPGAEEAAAEIPERTLRRSQRAAERLDLDWALLIATCERDPLGPSPAGPAPEGPAPAAPAVPEDEAEQPGQREIAELLRDPGSAACVTQLVEALAAQGRAAEAPERRPAATPPLEIPVDGATAVAGFGQRFGVFHSGIDFTADPGSPVRAAAAGVIVYAASHPTYGEYSCVLHRFRDPFHGRDQLTSCYGYQSSIAVELGDVVGAGEVIGSAGCPEGCIQSVIHFQVRDGSTPADPVVDPATFLEPGVDDAEGPPLDPP